LKRGVIVQDCARKAKGYSSNGAPKPLQPLAQAMDCNHSARNGVQTA